MKQYHRIIAIDSFRLLHGVVSRHAMSIMLDNYDLLKKGKINSDSCDCSLPYTHGLPCPHFIAACDKDRMMIDPSIINRMWKTLDT